MRIIGITGPTGAGKTTVLNILREIGAETIDADAVYHKLLVENKALKQALAEAFGAGILDEEGQVDRKRLSEAVYPDRLKELNGLAHPFVLSAVDERLRQAWEEGRAIAAIDAIALIESGAARRCGLVLAVTAPLEARVKRIMVRDGISEEYARRRALAQPSDDFFRAGSDFLIENNGSPEKLEAQARTLLKNMIQNARDW